MHAVGDRAAIHWRMPLPCISTISAGSETDTYIHLRIFQRRDQPAPPYSTNPATAQWLADRYGLTPVPVLESNSREPVAYIAVRPGQPQQGSTGRQCSSEMLAVGETVSLAIARSVLLLEELAEADFVVEDL